MSAKQRVPELPSLLPMNRGWCPIQRSVDDAEGQSARVGAGAHRGRWDRRRLREGRDLDAQGPVVPMPPPDPRLELRARNAARTERDLDPGRANAGLVSVELERQPGEDAAVRVVAADARADDALAADRSRAADVHADVGVLAVRGHRDAREDDIATGPADDARRRGGRAAAAVIPRESVDSVIAVAAVERRVIVGEVVVGDEDVVPAEAADRAGPDQDVGAAVPDQDVIAARLCREADDRVLDVGADQGVLARGAVVALAVEGHRDRAVVVVGDEAETCEADGVDPWAAGERVGAADAVKRVISGAAVEEVSSGAAHQ